MSDAEGSHWLHNNEYLLMLLAVSLVAQLGVLAAMMSSGRVSVFHSGPAATTAATLVTQTPAPATLPQEAEPQVSTAQGKAADAAAMQEAKDASRKEATDAPALGQSQASSEAARISAEALAPGNLAAPGGLAAPTGDVAASGATLPTTDPTAQQAFASQPIAREPSPLAAPAATPSSAETLGSSTAERAPQSRTEPTLASPPSQSAPTSTPASAEPPTTKLARQEPQTGGSSRVEQLLGPVPTIPSSSAIAAKAAAASYRKSVLSQVASAKRAGSWRGLPGTAAVHFVLGSKGEVLTCEVVRKSDDPALNSEAVAMVRRGAPYPVPPPDAKRDFTIGLRFEPTP